MSSSSSAASPSSISGVNAGFLWQIGKSGSLYFTNDHGLRSPLDNPKFVETFNAAQVIAFATLMEPEHKESCFRAMEQVFCKIAIASKKYISDDKLEELNTRLEELCAQIPSHPTVGKWQFRAYDDPRMQFLMRFFQYLGVLENPKKELSLLCSESLKTQALDAGKQVLSLMPVEKYIAHQLKGLKYLFKIPLFYKLVEHWILSPEWEQKTQDLNTRRARAWDLGCSRFWDNDAANRISAEEDKQLVKACKKEFGKKRYQIMDNISSLYLDGITSQENLTLLDCAEKIGELEKTKLPYMVISPDTHYKRLYYILTQCGMKVKGPLRESMKPIGFLWEIYKANKVMGYFLGSIHVVPQWILDNFNSKTLEAFEGCDVLGVEVDVTREELSGSFGNVLDYFFSGYRDDETRMGNVRRIVREGLIVHQLECDESDPDYLQKGMELVLKALCAKYGIGGGIDSHFIKKAKERPIEIVDLEPVEMHKEYGELMDKEGKKDFSPSSYAMFKKMWKNVVCRNYPEILEMGMIDLLGERKLSKERKMAMEMRNMQMVTTTHRLITEGKKPFSIAGVGHFAGKRGMKQLMEALGYTVRQVFCEEPRQAAAILSASSTSSSI